MSTIFSSRLLRLDVLHSDLKRCGCACRSIAGLPSWWSPTSRWIRSPKWSTPGAPKREAAIPRRFNRGEPVVGEGLGFGEIAS